MTEEEYRHRLDEDEARMINDWMQEDDNGTE